MRLQPLLPFPMQHPLSVNADELILNVDKHYKQLSTRLWAFVGTEGYTFIESFR